MTRPQYVPTAIQALNLNKTSFDDANLNELPLQNNEWEEAFDPSSVSVEELSSVDTEKNVSSATTSPEQLLWRMVITQALVDARSRMQGTEARLERNRARHWLLHGGADFTMVCELAGMDANYVRRRVRNILLGKARSCTVTGRKSRQKKSRYPDRMMRQANTSPVQTLAA